MKRDILKRIFAAALSSTLVLGMTACAGNNPPAPAATEEASQEETQEAVQNEPSEEKADELAAYQLEKVKSPGAGTK